MDENNPFYKIDGGSMQPLGRALKEYVELQSFELSLFFFRFFFYIFLMTPSIAKLEIKKLREYKKSCRDPDEDLVEFKDQISVTGMN